MSGHVNLYKGKHKIKNVSFLQITGIVGIIINAANEILGSRTWQAAKRNPTDTLKAE